uniref:MFS domain-containing protein n=1 Tax=Panagrellus redivivus TaxID=6233 RepID=A0A7E4V1V5_PANRE
MLRFILVFVCYSSIVCFRRLFFLTSDQSSAEIGYAKAEYGNIVSAYSLCYTVSKLFLGTLNDVIHPAKLLAGSIAFMSVALFGMSTATSVYELYFWVSLTALVQGGAWLATVKILKQNYESDQFPMLYTMMNCTSNVSGMVGPFLMAGNWKNICISFGSFGTILAIIAYVALTNRPVQLNEAKETRKLSATDCKDVLLSPTIWKISIFMLFSIQIRAIFEMWSPVFLSELPESQDTFKQCSLLFEMGGAIGGIVSGFAVQYLQTYFEVDSVRWNVASLCTCMAFIGSSSFFTSSTTHDGSSFLMGAAVYACINVYGMISADAAPYRICATANAVISFLSNMGPILAGTPLALLIEKFGFVVVPTILQYQTAFFISLLFLTKQIPLAMRTHSKTE